MAYQTDNENNGAVASMESSGLLFTTVETVLKEFDTELNDTDMESRIAELAALISDAEDESKRQNSIQYKIRF
jgi:hypothetical protein